MKCFTNISDQSLVNGFLACEYLESSFQPYMDVIFKWYVTAMQTFKIDICLSTLRQDRNPTPKFLCWNSSVLYIKTSVQHYLLLGSISNIPPKLFARLQQWKKSVVWQVHWLRSSTWKGSVNPFRLYTYHRGINQTILLTKNVRA